MSHSASKITTEISRLEIHWERKKIVLENSRKKIVNERNSLLLNGLAKYLKKHFLKYGTYKKRLFFSWEMNFYRPVNETLKT